MARRRKTSPAEGVMDIMAMLSRWGGAKADSEFRGCTGYPACRGTRPID